MKKERNFWEVSGDYIEFMPLSIFRFERDINSTEGEESSNVDSARLMAHDHLYDIHTLNNDYFYYY